MTQKTRRKVLLSAYACSPTKGSEEGNGWSWASGLAARGFEVWCFTNVAYEKEILRAMEQSPIEHLHFVFVRLPALAEKYLLNPDSKKIYFHYNLWRRKAGRKAVKMHKELRFDIAHHVTYGSLQQGNFIWKIDGARKIFGPVGGGQKAWPVFKKYFEGAWRTEQLRDLISRVTTTRSKHFRQSIAGVDYLLVTNDDTRAMAEQTGFISSDKIHFVPDHAVPRQMEGMATQTERVSKKLNLLWVGRILPRKGLNLVLEALSRVPDSVNYHLTIVGGGPWLIMLKKWIREYHVDTSRLTITRQIPFDEVVRYYRESDVFLFCSLRDSFPMQISEALAFGLPVITLNIHGSAIALPDDCGIKITPASLDETLTAIADAVTEMYENPQLRKTRSQNALLHSKTNTWDHRLDTVVERFYENKTVLPATEALTASDAGIKKY